MCDEDEIAAKLRRNTGEDLIANLKRDIESFFAQKYSISSCQFDLIDPLGDDMARVDFTVGRDMDFWRRYYGNAGYVDGHLSLGEVIRLM